MTKRDCPEPKCEMGLFTNKTVYPPIVTVHEACHGTGKVDVPSAFQRLHERIAKVANLPIREAERALGVKKYANRR